MSDNLALASQSGSVEPGLATTSAQPMDQESSGSKDEAGNTSGARRIVLVGKSGVGKSATGNSILGAKGFLSKASLKSVTATCDKKSCNRNGRQVSVVDTPGFFDTKLSNSQTVMEVSKCVVLSAPGPHAILVVLQAGRFSKEEADTIKIIQDLFGKEAAKYIVILFTRRDDLEADGRTVKEFVEEAEGKLKKLLQKCRMRYCAFNNRATGEEQERQISELLGMIDKMVEGNGGKCYSTEAFQMAEQLLKEKAEKHRKKYEQKKEQKLKQLRSEYKTEMNRIEKGNAEDKENKREMCTENYQKKRKEIENYYEELVKGTREEAEHIVLHDVLHFLKTASVGVLVGGAVGTCVGVVGGPVGMAAGATVGATLGGALGSLITNQSVRAIFSGIMKEQTPSLQEMSVS